jgi:DNA modification methylase
MTELIWDGKYQDGQKSAPLRIALPFQTVETVNESAADRQRTRSLFAEGGSTLWRNRLIWGDKKYVLPSLLPELAGQVNLIYIDPPFDTGADFSFTAQIPDDPDTPGDGSTSFVKEPSVIEQKAYRDTWGRGLDSYLQWFYETAILMHELLHENGSIYVHLDWHVAHYAKTVLDEVFGADNFINEIIWKRKGGSANPQNRYGVVTDTILLYAKSDVYKFDSIFTLASDEVKNYIEQRFTYVDEAGRRYRKSPIISPNPRPNLTYQYKGYSPPKNGWSVSKSVMEQWDKEGKLVFPKMGSGERINRKIYLDEYQGQPIQNLWTDIFVVNPIAEERLNYPTQKPEALLERIIQASSNEGDLVLDCFCGSGTTAAVSEKLNRRWITCDLGRFAIHTARKRLLGVENVRPFVVQNLGKYERQQWQSGEFGDAAGEAEKQRAYTDFILQLYHARPLRGHSWLHGVKGGRMVHVGTVDAPVTTGDVSNIAIEFRRAMGTGAGAPTTNGVDVLGWDFAFELNETAKQQAAAANINMRFVQIPREVLEKKAVEQGDIHFYELAGLEVKATQKGKLVTLELLDFIISPEYVPQDVQSKITHWEQWIDYWAIDWDNHAASGGDTFHNQWQSFRTRQNKTLERKANHTYEAGGEYSVVVKVIDILGNDTTKTVKVLVK